MKLANNNSNSQTIEINLDQSDVNNNIAPSDLIQQECYTKLRDEIAHDLLKYTVANAQNNYPLGSGLVYFIDGTRGAGKSTFLQTAYEALSIESAFKKFKLGNLAYIDPSRIENSEIILLPILKALRNKYREFEDASHNSGNKTANALDEKFKKLAGGLSLFAAGNDQLKDLDPELFLDWGLERAGHGTELRNNLHGLIKEVCKILDLDALVLAFDDADTNTSNASHVLECIRKYLDTPQLVVLVTGDMELYSQLVRDHFLSGLGDRGKDKDRELQRAKMVDHLEDQYLLKLFPVRRRVQLRPLWNIRNKYQFRLACAEWANESRTLDSAVNELIRRGLRIQDSRDLALYYEFLLKQPLRSVLQVLSRCATYLSKSDDESLSSKSSEELSMALSEGLRAIALGRLYKFGIDVDAIGAQEMPALIEAVFELTVRDGDLDTGAYLRPQPSDAALKNCFAALSADVSVLCDGKPNALLQYMYGGPGSVAIYGQVLRRRNRDIERDEAKDVLRAQFKKYIGIGRKEDALNWAWHATTILTAAHSVNPTRPVVDLGVIGLNKSKPKNASGVTAKTAISQCVKREVIPTFAFSLVDVSGQGGRTFASIFNILGLLDRLLSLKIDRATLEGEVMQALAKVFKTPTISRPGWEAGIAIAADEDEGQVARMQATNKEDLSSQESTALSNLSKNVAQWLIQTEDLHDKLKPSAVMIGKIWTRLYFSLEKVSEDRRRANTKAAALMEFFALCVINAFLIEELDHHLLDISKEIADGSSRKIDRSNPVTSTAVVANKFKGKVTREKFPLTFLIASCPLILGLLNNDKNQYGAMIETLFTNEGHRKLAATYFCDSESWKSVELACIAGWKWPEKNDA